MKRPAFLLVLLVLGLARAQPPQPASPAPAKPAAPSGSAQNWSMHTFSDTEGYRQMSVRGSEVHPAGPDIIGVTDLSITVYSGDAAAHVDTMLLSPSAMFFSKENRANGEKTVRVIRDDFEATGQQWSYDHAQKRVLLHQNVRVVFHAALTAILK